MLVVQWSMQIAVKHALAVTGAMAMQRYVSEGGKWKDLVVRGGGVGVGVGVV